MKKVITYSAPNGEEISLCAACVKKLSGNWPKNSWGEEFCTVSHGRHSGYCCKCEKTVNLTRQTGKFLGDETMKIRKMSCANYAHYFPDAFPVFDSYGGKEEAEEFAKNKGLVVVTDDYHQYHPPANNIFPKFDLVRSFLWRKP